MKKYFTISKGSLFKCCPLTPLMVSTGEDKECFIKLSIVDICTIPLIIRTLNDISAVYSEITFVILCALKREFWYFYIGELWDFENFCLLR